MMKEWNVTRAAFGDKGPAIAAAMAQELGLEPSPRMSALVGRRVGDDLVT